MTRRERVARAIHGAVAGSGPWDDVLKYPTMLEFFLGMADAALDVAPDHAPDDAEFYKLRSWCLEQFDDDIDLVKKQSRQMVLSYVIFHLNLALGLDGTDTSLKEADTHDQPK